MVNNKNMYSLLKTIRKDLKEVFFETISFNVFKSVFDNDNSRLISKNTEILLDENRIEEL